MQNVMLTLPIVDDEGFDLAEAVRNTALLADLTIGMWGAERTDPKIMAEAKAAHGAKGNVGRAIKNLMAGSDAQLKAVRAAYSAARLKHYSLTLPWVINPSAERQTGARLLPNMLFPRYVGEMGKLKREAEDKLRAFIVDYPRLAQEARANLAGLADLKEYPTPEQVERAFSLSFDFQPIPSAANFQGLPPGAMDKLAKRLRDRQEAAALTSQQEMWNRVKDTVGHLIGRLDDVDNKFKAASVEAVRELVEVLPGFNATGDVRVTEVVGDIERMLRHVTPEDLRKDNALRRDVCEKSKQITGKLASWGL